METTAPISVTRSYYDILGVENTASIADINEAYEKAAYGQKKGLEDKDMEAYHEATKAYQTLIDPNKRRQYDLSGAIEEGEEYDGLDVQSLGGIGRVFGAMISRFGVPLQTAISQDTLNSAVQICSNGGLLGGGSCLDGRVDDLVWGWSMEGRVERQVAKFYRITIDQQHVDNGFIIFCRSLSGKFKLVLFDAEGSVLHIEESLKSRDKSQTETALYFTSSFDTYHLGAPVPNVVREQDVPAVFSSLGSFAKCNLAVSAGQYLLCVYGDNFIGRTNFSILAVPTSNSCEEAQECQQLDAAVLEKKEELSQFQMEYLEAREKFEQATRRLKTETATVDDLVDRREFAYSSFLVASADAFLPSAEPHPHDQSFTEHGQGHAGSEGGQQSHSQSSGTTASATATIKGIIPSGETLAHMTSSATSTANAAGGWMSSRLSSGLNKLMVASGAIPPPEDQEKSVFDKDVDVIDMDEDVAHDDQEKKKTTLAADDADDNDDNDDNDVSGGGDEDNEESFKDTVEGGGGGDEERSRDETRGDDSSPDEEQQQQQEQVKQEEQEEGEGGSSEDQSENKVVARNEDKADRQAEIKDEIENTDGTETEQKKKEEEATSSSVLSPSSSY